MKDAGSGVGVKNIKTKKNPQKTPTKNPTKEQINEYKMTEREIYEKSANLSEDKLNTKSNKNIYVKRWCHDYYY